MPIISQFYGIIISMYYRDNDYRHQPHIHVRHSGQEAVISIPDGQVLGGAIKGAKLKLVQKWIGLHRDELMADWNLAVNGQPVFKIDPLK
jgi:hypothetical protein